MISKTYSVKQLAKLSGTSVRALHLYDKMGLLKPSSRTSSKYRQYGEAELLRLQQILFYKEMDIPLKEIKQIMDDKDFDLVKALAGHKKAIAARRDRLNTLLKTIDRTIDNLKNKTMTNADELYEGMPREQAMAYRQEAIDKWGEETVVQSEKALMEMDKLDLEQLKANQKDIAQKLKELVEQDPQSETVQKQITRHYQNIKGFWGIAGKADLKADTYRGLAQLYVSDDRYYAVDGVPDIAFATFMRRAMNCFADRNLV